MFKRSTKITSLLVAAASVASTMTPVMAADVKRIDTEEGIVYDALAYKDGVAVINAELDDKDSSYYYSEGKFKELDDVDSSSTLKAYGEKYAKADDGNYFIDLTSGKVTEDKVDEDDEDDAASALRKKVKDVERYNEDDRTAKLVKVIGNKFGENWYYTTDYKHKDGSNSVVFTDSKGNYIDADYNLGKIKVKVTAESVSGSEIKDTFTVENTKDTEKTKFNKETIGVKASIDASKTVVLGQDKDNFYRYAEVVLDASKNDDVTTEGVITEVFGNTKLEGIGTSKVTLKVIQKISKAQASDDVEDAKYAKNASCYVISKDNGQNEDKDKELATLLKGIDMADENNDTLLTVSNGKLIVFKDNRTSGDDNVEIQAFALKQKNGYYYTDCEDHKKFSVEYSSELKRSAIDYDTNGNVWVIDGGYVKKFDNSSDLDKVYKVDGSMDSLSVYDKDNMIVWSQDDEVYSIIGGKTKVEEPVVEEPATPAVTAGWNQAADGTYTYVNADGTTVKGWFQSPASGKWFYLDPTTGVMQTGWVQSPASGKWFYMNPSNGDMMTGWVQVGTTWYYMDPTNGDMKTGWVNDGNAWYYMDASGAMLSNTTVDGYVLGANGAWVK